jgi:hypothetical protein
MSTATKTRTPRQVTRTVRLKLAPHADAPGIVNIAVGKAEQDYLVLPLPSDFGRSFLLEKTDGQDATQYHVCLNGEHSTCECEGFLRHGIACNGGTGCKHIGGLNALVAEGKL